MYPQWAHAVQLHKVSTLSLTDSQVVELHKKANYTFWNYRLLKIVNLKSELMRKNNVDTTYKH